MAGTTSVGRMLLPEPFDGTDDVTMYITQFELLSTLQNWNRNTGDATAPVWVDDRPHYFALRLQKGAIEFYQSLPDGTKNNYANLKKAFEDHYSDKSTIYEGRLSRRVQNPGEKLEDFKADLQKLARKAFPAVDEAIRAHMVLQGFLHGVSSPEVRVELRKKQVTNIDDALKAASELDAIYKLEAETSQTVTAAAINRPEKDPLVEQVTELVRVLSIHENRERGRHRERSGDAYPSRWRNRSDSSHRSSRQSPEKNRRDNSPRFSRATGNFRSDGYRAGLKRTRDSPEPGQRHRRDSRSPGQRQSFRQRSQSRSPSPKGAAAGYSSKVRFEDERRCRKCNSTRHQSHECQSCFGCGGDDHYRKDCPFNLN